MAQTTSNLDIISEINKIIRSLLEGELMQSPEVSRNISDLLYAAPNLMQLKAEFLGKNSLISQELKSVAGMPPEQKATYGNRLNICSALLNECFKQTDLLQKKRKANEKMKASAINKNGELFDISRPYAVSAGGVHPISLGLEQIAAIFYKLGFSVREGAEIVSDWQNFGALNFGELHPARESHDTFYLKDQATSLEGSREEERENSSQGRSLLRTHTSGVQIDAMKSEGPPLKIVAPGRVYRSDSDATHSPMFHQVEGLYINKDASVAQLKDTLLRFCQLYFGLHGKVPLRFRPSYFPFTTPSWEVDIKCHISKEAGKIILGQGDTWLEILGCGMVHPKVLKNGGINPAEWQGFAFGIGVERLIMLKYGFSDLRDFYNSKCTWLQHYNIKPLGLRKGLLA